MRGYHETLCGPLNEAASTIETAVSIAREETHTGTYKWALSWAGAQPTAMWGDVETTLSLVAELLALPKKLRFPINTAWGEVLDGWTMANQGNFDSGSNKMRDSIGYLVDEGIIMYHSVRLALLAQVHIDHEQWEAAHAVIEEVAAAVLKHDEYLDARNSPT